MGENITSYSFDREHLVKYWQKKESVISKKTVGSRENTNIFVFLFCFCVRSGIISLFSFAFFLDILFLVARMRLECSVRQLETCKCYLVISVC